MGRGGFQGIDLAADDEHFAVAYHHISIGQLDFAFARGLDLPAFQHHACLEAFFKKIVEGGFFVVRDPGLGCCFAGHEREK